MPNDYQDVRQALRTSHEHLSGIVKGLSASELSAPSYCADWNVAQCLSHLGSGGEIGLLLFQHAIAGTELPGREAFEPIWDKWNARSPEEVGAAVLPSDAAQLEAFETADPNVLGSLNVAMFGRELDAAGLMSMRLGEHVLHTWDVEVISAPQASLQPTGVEILIDRSPQNATRFAHGERPAHRGTLNIVTTAPDRKLVLDLSKDDVTLAPGEFATADVVLPAESLIRLLYGRLDPEHTPSSVEVSGPVSLDELRKLFPGF
jgi:uncharacterized protein (TIGR03083 family)